MSDRHMFGNRKYLLLVIPLLLLLGWFMFAPGSDQKKDRTSTANTSQKTLEHKDPDKDQKSDNNAGRVDATNTTTPSPATTTHKSKPKSRITTASAAVNNSSPAPSQTPSQTPPANNQQEPPVTEPVCVAYENQTIRLTAGSTTNECYTLTRTDAKTACWIPYTYRVVTTEGVTTVTKESVSIEGKPIVIIENANTFKFDDPATFVCPVYDTHLQFRVHAPENVQPADQPGASYDYQLQVDSMDRPKDPVAEPNGGSQTETIPDAHNTITVDITEGETADAPEESAALETPADNPEEQLPLAA